MRHVILPFLSGGIFALGLALSGMTRPAKIISFLDITRDWDPSLAFVMVGAILVYSVLYRLISKRQSSWFGGKISVSLRNTVDRKLILGALIFGIGWAIAGYCPGPALASLFSGGKQILVFMPALIVGIVAHKYFASKFLPPSNG